MKPKKPNILVQPNVICKKLENAENGESKSLSDREIAKRISYWSLKAFSYAYLFTFKKWFDDDKFLSPLQKAQRDADLRPSVLTQWNTSFEFKALGSLEKITPFFEGWQREEVEEIEEEELEAEEPEAEEPEEELEEEIEEIAEEPEEEDWEEIAEELEEEDWEEEAEAAPAVETPEAETETLAVAKGQKSVLDAPMDQNILVLAPPGTGKTWVLIERLSRLMESNQIQNPYCEVLVLSFSRAAVGEIKKRLAHRVEEGAQDDLRYIQVATFDSFATLMLRKDLEQEELKGKGYDGRIQMLTEALRENDLEEAMETLEQVRFLFVDEIQDIVGVRAEIVLELAKIVISNGGAVCFLGDPAQAIFDWTVKDSNKMTSTQFLRGIERIIGVAGLKAEFSEYHRYVSEEMKEFVARARKMMGLDGRSPDGLALIEHIVEVASPKEISDLPEICKQKGQTAILTRSNLEVYQVSKWCKQEQIPHTILKGSQGSYSDGWVGRLVFGFKNDKMSKEMAKRRWNTLVQERGGDLTFEKAWELFEEQDLLDRDNLDLRKLLYFIRRQDLQAPGRGNPSDTVISTIHRSKGREFDQVVMVNNLRNKGGKKEEVRVLYVAATRAKEKFYLLKKNRKVFYKGKKDWGWIEKLNHFKSCRKKQNYILLDGLSDLNYAGLTEKELKTMQDFLWESFSSSQGEVEVRNRNGKYLLEMPHADGKIPLAICEIARGLQSDIESVCRCKTFQALKNITVIDLATVVLDVQGRQLSQTGSAMLITVPVIYGEAWIEME